MWMGGTIPLAYDVADRKLVVNETEAQAILTAFSTSAVRGPKLVSGSLLQGLIVDRHGRTMGPVHTTRNGQRFRYYVTHPRTIREGDPAPYRLAADAIELGRPGCASAPLAGFRFNQCRDTVFAAKRNGRRITAS